MSNGVYCCNVVVKMSAYLHLEQDGVMEVKKAESTEVKGSIKLYYTISITCNHLDGVSEVAICSSATVKGVNIYISSLYSKLLMLLTIQNHQINY